MAKKKLILNESTTRRFMKLATIKPTYVSNFLTEAEKEEEEKDEKVMKEQEEDEALEPEEGEGLPEAEPEMDMDMETEDEAEAGGAGDAEALVMDLLAKVQEFAEENGVSMELEGDEDEEGDDMEMDDEGMEMDAELEGGDAEEPDEAEMPEDAEANYGGAMQEEIDADLEAAGVSVIDEEEIIAEVTKRVARRLLRESAKRK